MPLSPNEAALIRRLQDRVDLLTARLNAVKVGAGADQPASLPGQYPGKPIPHTEGVEIDVGANTNAAQGNITIAADGPFMAKRIHFAWRETDGTYVGEWRATSSVHDLAGNVGNQLINFYWEYQVSGSHRNRQNIPVPSACVDRAEEGNGYWDFAVQDVFAPTSTITIKVTPTVAPSYAGVLYCGFHGAYVLE